MKPLNPGEKVLLMVRKHWLVIARDIVIIGAIIIAPLIVYGLTFIFPFPDIINIPGSTIYLWMFIWTFWILLLWTILFIAWTDYYLDILVITNQRIFDIEQFGLFNRHSSTFRLDRIQDVTVQVKGMIPTFFKFGHIHIQTAGEQREFIASYIPQPYKVKEKIMQQHDKAMEMMHPRK